MKELISTLLFVSFLSFVSYSADRFWVGGTGSWTDNTNHWSATSGGAPGASVPGVTDTVFFDANSGLVAGSVVSIDAAVGVVHIDFSGVANTFEFNNTGSFAWILSGSLTSNASGVTFNGTWGEIEMNAALLGESVTSGGTTWIQDFRISGQQISLTDDLTLSNASLYVDAGGIDLAGNNLSCLNFFSQTTNARSIDISNALVDVTGGNWQVDSTSLILTSASSLIELGNTAGIAVFEGGGLVYDTLRSLNATQLNHFSSNTFSFLDLPSSSTLNLEDAETLSTDSLLFTGTCAVPAIMQASPGTINANFSKTGFGTIDLSGLHIIDVNAVAGPTYNVALGDLQNSSGWTLTGSNFYWIGNSGNWNDGAHWSATSGGPAIGCVPTFVDSVFFDANSFSLANQTVTVDDSAFFKSMTWTGIIGAQALVLDSSMFSYGDITLHPNLSLSRNVLYSGIRFNEAASLDANNAALIDVSLLITTTNSAQIVSLSNDLFMTDSSSILLFNGRLNTLNNDIKTGTIQTINDPTSGADQRRLILGSSEITLLQQFIAFGDTALVITPGTSTLIIGDTLNYFNSLITEGKGFYNVKLNWKPLSTQQTVLGGNTFNKLEITAGSQVYFDDNLTQTVNDSLIIRGNCRDSVSISTTDPTLTNVAFIDKNGPGTEVEATCVRVSGINANGATLPFYFSANNGSNTNINFLATAPVVTAFEPDSLLSSFCYGDTVYFENSSLPFNGTFADLAFDWYVADGSLPLTDDAATIEAQKLNHQINYSQTSGVSSNAYAQIPNWTEITDASGIFNPLTSAATITPGNEGMSYNFTVGYRFSLVNGTGSTAHLVDMNAAPGNVAYNFNPKLKIYKNGAEFGAGSPPFSFPMHSFAEGALANGVTQIGADTITFNAVGQNLNPSDLLTIHMGADVGFTGFTSQPRWKDANLVGANDVTVSYRIDIDTIYFEAVPINPAYEVDSLIHEFQTSGDSIIVALTATDTRNFCQVTDTFFISITKPNISVLTSEPDLTLCPWETVSHEAFSAVAGTQFEFFINGVSQNTPSVNDTLLVLNNLSDQDTISVLAYEAGCVSDTMPSFIYTVFPTPVFTWSSSDADTSICVGDLVNFTASSVNPGYNFAYLLNSSQVTAYTSGGLYNTSTLADGDSVFVVGRDANLCTDTLNMVFNVDPLPTTSLSESIGGNVICAGQSVLFTAIGADQYEFFVDGVSVQGPSATATFSTTSLTTGNVVSVMGIDNNGCEKLAPETFSYIVLAAPVTLLSSSDPDSTICSGTPVNFTAGGAAVYEFFVNGVSVQGPSPTLTYSSSTLADGDVIYVEGTSSGCSSSSSDITMTVFASPTTTLNSDDADNSICSGTSVTFTAGGATNYQFFVNGVSQGAPSPTTTFVTSSLTNGQTVSVQGESNSCIVSQQLVFTVLNNPNTQLFDNDADNTICSGGNITFTGANAALYQFFVNGSSVQGPSSSSTLVNPALGVGANAVYVLGTAANGCSVASSTINITVNAIPSIVVSSSDLDNTICAGDAVTFTATGGSMYQFLINGVPQGVLSPTNTFNTSSLTNGQTISVNGQLLGCSSVSNLIVTTVNAIPPVAFSSSDIDNVYCSGDVVTYTATGATNYEFFVDGLSQGPSSPLNTINSTGFAAGSYDVEVIGESNNCFNSEIISVVVNTLPSVTISSSDLDNTICQGGSVTYTGSGAALYQFFVNGVSQGAPSSNPNYTINSLVDSDVVSIIGSSSQGCIDSDAMAAITVSPIPTVTLSSSDIDEQICLGENVDFTASGANNYEFFIDGVSQGPSSPINTLSTIGLSNNDAIQVIGETAGCSAASTTLVFDVFGSPIVFLTNNGDNQICVGENTDLAAAGASNYQFQVNGVPAGGFSPVNTFTSPLNDGDIVTVIGETNGCTGTSATSISFVVNSFPSITSFSSDADNIICLNDLIDFNASGAMTYEFLLNGISVQNGPASTFDIQTLEDGDEIEIIGYNGDCPSAADSYIFTVNSMNLDMSVSASALICEDETVTFTATGADEYEFFINGVSQGVPSATNTFVSSNIADNDQVTFTGFNNTTSCTQAYHDFILMNVIDAPTVSAQSATTFCAGDSVILLSNSPYGNQWYLDGNPIPGATDSIYVAYTSGSYSLDVASGGTGDVWSFGQNANGTIGNGDNLNYADPTAALTTTTFDELSSGFEFVLGVSTTGEVYAWGENNSGQLGNGTYTSSNVPQLVPTLSGIKTVATSENSSMAVTNAGATYVWGNNTNGQLGTGNTSVINFPFLNAALNNVDSIAGGRSHFVILRTDGTVWTVGNNAYGQLGQGNLITSFNPVQVPGLSNVVSVGAGEYHSFAINNLGEIYGWGNNGSGQLGLGDLTNRLTPTLLPIADVQNAQGGAVHSAFLTTAGEVYTAGGNDFGQLGTSSFVGSLVPSKVDLSGVNMISTGQYTTLTLRNDQSVFGFGDNTEDQLSSSTLTVATPEHISDLDGVTFIEASRMSSHFIYGLEQTCNSSAVSVTELPVPTVIITEASNLLTATAGSSYQWYFNGNPIPGANGQTHLANQPGDYSVEVTFANGCTGISNTYTLESLADIADLTDSDIKVYPVPTDDELTIEVGFTGSYTILVTDQFGRVVLDQLENGSKTLLNVAAFENGVYHITIIHGDEHVNSKFVKLD